MLTLRFQARAKNTYLLALDGDIDFQPEAVTRLVDLMKKNKNLGAACGRYLLQMYRVLQAVEA